MTGYISMDKGERKNASLNRQQEQRLSCLSRGSLGSSKNSDLGGRPQSQWVRRREVGLSVKTIKIRQD